LSMIWKANTSASVALWSVKTRLSAKGLACPARVAREQAGTVGGLSAFLANRPQRKHTEHCGDGK
jgi:hypothetical protein